MKFTILITLALSTMSMSAAAYAPALPELEAVIREEMAQWGIGGVAVALVDDQSPVYLRGFGEAKADSVFRVGSISKLFNAIAVMQQVEAGKLDLDAPIDPALLPTNPFPESPAVTLRQLLCHRSGLQRESTVGSYFDPHEPTLGATVASLRDGVLATRPGEKMRYSNIGATLAGRLVEIASGVDFVKYQTVNILEPLGMKRSAWACKDLPAGALVKSHMRVADGHGGWTRREAPSFDLGTVPAGNLFASAGDVARFASAMLAGGKGLLEAESLAEMWKPQLTEEENGFGLGFVAGKFRGHKSVGHGGAVYGFSTSLVILPEAKVAAIVLANEDIANGRVTRIGTAALSALLEVKHGEKAPAPPAKFEPINLKRYVGAFESQSYWAKLSIQDGELVANISGQPTTMTATAEHTFLANSRIHYDTKIKYEADASGFVMGEQIFRRVDRAVTKVGPQRWKHFLGSYGPDFIPLIISQRHGNLYAMTENMVDYRLTPVNQNVFELPPGMYRSEHLVFLTNAAGKTPRINFCNMFFERN